MIKNYLQNRLKEKTVLILGFGREGKSTYNFLRKSFPEKHITIADSNSAAHFPTDKNCTIISGETYLDQINSFDIIFKTPGISLKNITVKHEKIISQTAIFLELFKSQVIGITGTKGKSTTASLIYHIIKQHTSNVILTGNIGTPAFDSLENINNETIIVFELSSHQLEYVNQSPHISILLNLFQEHLDHYNSYEDYQKAKIQIAKFQSGADSFIYNYDDPIIESYLNEISLSEKHPISIKNKLKLGCFSSNNQLVCNHPHTKFEYSIPKTILKGEHNHYNIMAAVTACKLKKIPDEVILKGIETYQGLEHRLEYIGKFKNIHFYNDSIATIPEATIAALRAIKNVNTIILGGFDRGIDYTFLVQFIDKSEVRNIILLAEAGNKIKQMFEQSNTAKKIFLVESMEQAVRTAFEETMQESVCLLSPAAASYGMFKDFKDRGDKFRHWIHSISQMPEFN